MARSVCRRELCSRKKRGTKVGKTKRGKGTKWMVVADGTEIPLACTIASASPSEVTLVEETLETVPRHEGEVTPLIADRGYDSDPLREHLIEQGWDLICPHRRGRVRKATQDGRKLRRYKRRWKIERTIAWIGNYRRALIRNEYYSCMSHAFIQLACAMTCLKMF